MGRTGAISAALVLAISIGVKAQDPPAKGNAARTTSTFVTQMAIAGMAEVELGRMASERAASADVKMFGQMMVKDHTQANNELTRIASQMKIEMPKQLDQKHRDLVDRLSKLKGAEFDREYMNAMVPGHEEVAKQLRSRPGGQTTSKSQESPTGTSGVEGEQALNQWAAKTLPTVEQHLENAREIQQKVAK